MTATEIAWAGAGRAPKIATDDTTATETLGESIQEGDSATVVDERTGSNNARSATARWAELPRRRIKKALPLLGKVS